jgi:cytochrome c-type biogenesis protein CcmH/NrfG
VKLSKKNRRYVRRHAGELTPEEMSKALGVPVEAIRKALGDGSRRGGRRDPPDAARILGRLVLWMLVGLAALVPFVVFPKHYDFASLPKSVLIQTTALVALAAWFAKGALEGRLSVVWTGLLLPLAAFLAWCLLSLTWAHNGYEGMVVWIHWASCAVVCFLVLNAVRSPRDAGLLVNALFWSGSAVALLGMLQYLLRVSWVPQSLTPAATFGNKNLAAQYIVLTLPLGVLQFLGNLSRGARSSSGSADARPKPGQPEAGSPPGERHALWDWAYAVACGLGAAYLFHTFAKAAWLAAVVEAALLAVFLSRRHTRSEFVSGWQPRRFAALGAGAAVFLVLTGLTPEGFRWRLGGAVEEVERALEWPGGETDAIDGRPGPAKTSGLPDGALAPPGSDVHAQAATQRKKLDIREGMRIPSLGIRTAIWRNALGMVREHPVRGVGLGNFMVCFPRHSNRVVLVGIFADIQPRRAHNDYVQVLVELGVVGLGLLGWFGFSLVRLAIRTLSSGTPAVRRLGVASAVCVAGLAVNALFSFPMQLAVPPLAFMIYVGILGALEARGKKAARAGGEVSIPGWASAVLCFAAVAALSALLWFQCRRIRGDKHMAHVIYAKRKGLLEQVVAQGRQVLAHDPWRKEVLVHVGWAQMESGRPRLAAEAFEGALEAYPFKITALGDLGGACWALGERERAVSCQKRVLAIKPDDAIAHNNLGYYYEQLGRPDDALDEYRLAAAYDPQKALFHLNLGRALSAKGRREEAGRAFEKALDLAADDKEREWFRSVVERYE